MILCHTTRKVTTVKVSEIYGGQYLKADDIPRQGASDTIAGCRIQEFDDGKQVLCLALRDREDEKELRLNKTNALSLAEHYGDETSEWIGKVVHMMKGKTQFQGKQVDCIYVSADNNGVPF